MNLQQIDIKQLIILKHLLEEKHVSNTALQLSISQPTVSRSLNRLRDLFDDPLLLKTNNGLELTSKADSIKSQLNSVLSNLEDLLSEQQFDPLTSDKTIRLLGLTPHIEQFVPPLLKHLAIHAPNMVIEIDSIPQPPFTQLHSGDCHFAITSHKPLLKDQNLHSVPLTQCDFRLLMNAEHPLAQQELNLENLRQCQFGQLSLQGEKRLSIESRFQSEDDPNFHVATPIRLNNFACVAAIAATTEIIFHLPTHYAQSISSQRNLVIREVPEPLSLHSKEIKLYWHKRFHHDPAAIWIRAQLKDIANNMQLNKQI